MRRPVALSLCLVLAGSVGAFAVACGASRKPSDGALVVAPLAGDAAAPASAASTGPAVTPVAESPARGDAGGPPVVVVRGGPARDADAGPLCGCSLCEPVWSDDACASDADCAPSMPCHADRCIARAKAKPRPLNMMCTMQIRCDTIDANACGCLRGRCALYPKTK